MKYSRAAWKVKFMHSRVNGERFVSSADIYAGDKRIGAATIRPELPWEANAHLMAAAPDLYKALRSFVEGWEFENLEAMRDVARAAISKAESGVSSLPDTGTT